MARLLTVVAFGAVVGLLYWIAQSGVIEERFGPKGAAAEQFTLELVRIKMYDDAGSQYMTVTGNRAVVNKDFKTVQLDDIRVVDERTKPPGTLRADVGFRRMLRKVEQLHFQRNVVLERGPESTLKSSELFFYPKENIVEVPVPCVITTTDTTVSGDFLQSSTTLKSGTVRGNVRIVRAMTGEDGTPRPVTITGDLCPFDAANGVYTVTGNVAVVQQGLKLTCHEAQYQTRNERAWARGMVAATDPEVILTCDELEYDARHDVVYISAKPDATTTPSASRTTYRVPDDPTTFQLTELHGKKMIYRRAQGTLDAEDEVLVVRWSLEGAELRRDFEIRSDKLRSVYQGDATTPRPDAGRSNFTGRVRIVSDKVGAQGDRAVFYEATRNFYVIGRATAWDYDAQGRRTNQISGGKILHDSVRGRNIVLEGVSGSFSEGGSGQ